MPISKNVSPETQKKLEEIFKDHDRKPSYRKVEISKGSVDAAFGENDRER